MDRFPFSAFPDGWYAVAFTADLPRGGVTPLTAFGTEYVLFRTGRGEAVVLDAYCPHMGAHLGHGGRVEGETVRCPMHGFRFDATGACVATGYQTKVPLKCRTSGIPVREVDGVIFARDNRRGGAQGWEPPEVGFDGWAPLRTAHFENVPTHPQETTENSVDLGHFSAVHGYRDVEIVEPLAANGAHLSISYRMKRKNLIPFLPQIGTRFDITIWGLGYSFVEVTLDDLPIKTRYFVLPVPRDESHIDLRLGMSFKVDQPLLGRVPPRLYDRLIGKLHADSFVGDVLQDFDIWRHKKYVHPPVLAEGDGPVGQYRRWARRFYAEAEINESAETVTAE